MVRRYVHCGACAPQGGIAARDVVLIDVAVDAALGCRRRFQTPGTGWSRDRTVEAMPRAMKTSSVMD